MCRRSRSRRTIVRINQVRSSISVQVSSSYPRGPTPRRRHHRLIKLLCRCNQREQAQRTESDRLVNEAAKRHGERSEVHRGASLRLSAFRSKGRRIIESKRLAGDVKVRKHVVPQTIVQPHKATFPESVMPLPKRPTWPNPFHNGTGSKLVAESFQNLQRNPYPTGPSFYINTRLTMAE